MTIREVNILRIMLLGAPGAGKGSQAAVLSRTLSVPHVSTGDIFRHNIANGTELGIKAKQFMDNGMLVPDDLTVDIVEDRLKQADCKNGFILDGFPRTTKQAEYLEKVLDKMGIKLDVIVNIVLDDDIIVARLSGRRVCPNCNEVYHIQDRPSKLGESCEKCGTATIQRIDDTEETIRKRLKVYHEQTEPLLDFYKDKVRFINAKSDKTLENTSKQVFDQLSLLSV